MPNENPSFKARVIRRAHFSAAYEEPSSKAVHGHNYILEACVEGPIQQGSGMVIGIAELKELLHLTTRKLDHKFLNRDVKELLGFIPTAENLARFCFEDLALNLSSLKHLRLFKVRLYETEDLWVDYSPGPSAEIE